MRQDGARVQHHAAGLWVFFVAVFGQTLVNLNHDVLRVRFERIAIKAARRFGGGHHQRGSAGRQRSSCQRQAKRPGGANLAK